MIDWYHIYCIFFWFNKKNTLTSKRSFNVQLLKQVSAVSELPLSSMSENRCSPCVLSPLPDLPRFPHTQACACTDVCTCIFAHMHAHTHMYDIHTLPLATLTEIQSPKAGSQRKARKRRTGQGLVSAGAEFRSVSQGAPEQESHRKVGSTYRQGGWPLSPCWWVMDHRGSCWARQTSTVELRSCDPLGWRFKSQSKCPQVTHISRCVFRPTDAHTHTQEHASPYRSR